MLSLTQFRRYCLPLFRIMAGSNMTLEVVYKGKVYDMTVRATDKEPKLERPIRGRRPQKILSVDKEVCPACGSMQFNTICMNSKCIHSTGNLAQAAETVHKQHRPE
jgi:hypothetical protein